MIMDKQLINDINCERFVVGTLIVYPEEFRNQEIGEILKEEMFYNPKYAFIFETIRKMNEDYEKIDLITVYNRIAQVRNDIGFEDILNSTEQIATSYTLRDNCMRIATLWQRRKLMAIGSKLMEIGTSELGNIEEIKRELVEAILSLDIMNPPKIQSNFEVAKEVSMIISDNLAMKTLKTIPTGFPEIDDKCGVYPSDLVIIAARSSQGKSSLALDFCVNAARNGHICAFYSLEMQATQLFARMLATETGVSSAKILRSPLEGGDLKLVEVGLGKVENLSIYYDDIATMSLEKIITSIRFLHRKKNIDVVFVDYLQILQNNDRKKDQNEEQFFGMAARRFKNLAKELNITIFLLSQISRTTDNSMEPNIAKLRGSGQIEETGDVVILIYRPELYNLFYTGKYEAYNPEGTALITIAKGRNIGTFEFLCRFEKERTHFSSIENINDHLLRRACSNSPF